MENADFKREVGFIGLGRMGYNMAAHLVEQYYTVIGYDTSRKAVKEAQKAGIQGTHSLEEVVQVLSSPRCIWLMVPAKQVDTVINELVSRLTQKDVIIDGGNSYFTDSIRRYGQLKEKGISFLDCGTSGGIQGARNGACLMVGGERDVFENMKPLFRALSTRQGYAYVGKTGSGHFTKMIHNAIEYGMMGAIAEGVQALQESPLQIDVKEAVRVYGHRSIVDGRLIRWLYMAYEEERFLDSIAGEVPYGETEREMEQVETLAQMPVLTAARLMRVSTRSKPSYAGKLIAAMRNLFGGHAVTKNEPK